MGEFKHGYAHTKTYKVWTRIINRCENKATPDYVNYGGRGIVVCERWRENFVNFLEDMGEKPDGMSIDRIDNDGPYSPENCRWADRQTQSENRRNVRLYTYRKKTQTIAAWAKELGFSKTSLHRWLVYDKMSFDRVITEKLNG